MANKSAEFSWTTKLGAWFVFLLTASGNLLGLFMLQAIYIDRLDIVFWLIALNIFIDGVDGTLARRLRVKEVLPQIDGALLDNMADFLTYVIVPAFLLLQHPYLLPPGWAIVSACVIVLASAYQFTQTTAKTDDHFFQGFPSYWNIVVFYFVVWQTSPWINLAFVIGFVILIFVPVKYIYPTRLKHISPYAWVKRATFMATLGWCFASMALLFIYPEPAPLLTAYIIAYLVYYNGFSLYRTLRPLEVVSGQ